MQEYKTYINRKAVLLVFDNKKRKRPTRTFSQLRTPIPLAQSNALFDVYWSIFEILTLFSVVSCHYLTVSMIDHYHHDCESNYYGE